MALIAFQLLSIDVMMQGKGLQSRVQNLLSNVLLFCDLHPRAFLNVSGFAVLGWVYFRRDIGKVQFQF
jgi:hypothetical protein